MGNITNTKLKEELFNREKHPSFGDSALLKQVYIDRINTALDMLECLLSQYINDDDNYIVYVGNRILKLTQKEHADSVEYYTAIAVINTLLQNDIYEVEQVTSDHIEQIQKELTSYTDQLKENYKEMMRQPIPVVTQIPAVTSQKPFEYSRYGELNKVGETNRLQPDYSQYAKPESADAALAAGGYQ